MNAALLKNWLTSVLGALAGLPLIVAGSGIVLDPKWNHYLTVAGGIGIIGLGVVSKAFNNHSTAAEVQAASQPKP